MIYDLDARKVGIALHTNSAAKIEEKGDTWIVAIVIIVIVVLAIIGVICWYKKK